MGDTGNCSSTFFVFTLDHFVTSMLFGLSESFFPIAEEAISSTKTTQKRRKPMLISDLSYLEVVSTESTDVVGGRRRGRNRRRGGGGGGSSNANTNDNTNTVTSINTNTNNNTSSSSITLSGLTVSL